MKYTFLLLLLVVQLISANEIKEKTESLIKTEFGNNVEITFTKYIIPPEIKSEIEMSCKQRFFSESIFVWSVKISDSLLALGIMDNVYGKSQPITFLTLFNLDGTIQSNHIVKYREEHGGAVSNYTWNKQFIGMDYNSNVKDEVDAISGATISVNSIKKGVKKLLLLFDSIKKLGYQTE